MKSITRLLLAIPTILLLASNAHAVSVQLQGLVPALGGSISDYGYGSRGLYLGEDWGNPGHRYTNWTWDTVTLDIQSSGDATIDGSMTRGDGSIWGINIQLSDISFVGTSFAGVTQVSDSLIDDIFASGENGAGIEFGVFSMSLTSPYRTSVPLTGWTGLAMPLMGHENVAELHYRDGKIVFDAWYQNPDNTHCWYCYNVGDSKAVVISTPVPEPSAALVFAAGIAVTSIRLRKRNA